MSLLGQQELLEAAPRRRLIVRRGRCAWWGIDPSTTRVAVAGVGLSLVDGSLDRWVRVAPFELGEGAERLAGIYSVTEALFADLGARAMEDGVPPLPGLVWVEQPSGRHDNPELSYAVGVILAAVHAGLSSVLGRVRVETVPSATWKKLATGYGAHYKPTKKKLGRTPVFEDYAVARWARENGYEGSSWDECDALGIAEAARREVALVER